MNKTCCPMYPIKCAALQFTPSKSQKKILKRFKHFVEKGEVTVGRGQPAEQKALNSEASVSEKSESVENRLRLKDPPKISASGVARSRPAELMPRPAHLTQSNSFSGGKKKRQKITSMPTAEERGAPSWAPRNGMKAKAFRRERWRQRQLARGMEVVPQPPRNALKSLEERLSLSDGPTSLHRFTVRLVATGSDVFTETFAESLAVYQRYQVAVHGDSLEKCSASQFKRFLCKV